VDGAERLLRDVHPVEVTIGDRVILAARVFVTDHRVVVYREGGAHDGRKRPDIAFSAVVTGDAPIANRGSLTGPLAVQTDVGTVRINRGRGCGCHSVLKALGPVAKW
jgi:hypothetical protein